MMKTESWTEFSIGQIKRIRIPTDWLKVEQNNPDLSSLVVFHPPSNPMVQLGFYYRGRPLSQSIGEAFQSLLSADARDLTPSQLTPIAAVLDDVFSIEQFHLAGASVQNISGRNVLAVKGRWLSTENESYEIFIDAGRTGTVVQQVYFVAPASEFVQYIDAVMESINALEWS